MAFETPLKIVIFTMVYFILEFFMLFGLVLTVGFSMNSPPTYSGNFWDAPFYAFTWLWWAFSGVGQFISVYYNLIVFSGIYVPFMIANALVGTFFFIGLLFYIRGTD